MKLRFRVLNENPFYDYREACKITQGIDMADKELQSDCLKFWQPKDETTYWIKQIIANHSTIRSIHFRLVDTRPKSVINQIIRATKGHPQPYVESSRPDWTGKERSFDPYEDKMFMQDHTAESFVEMAKQRLCERTEKRTKEFMWEMVETLRRSSDPFLKAVGYCCHPNCWWSNGKCPEVISCHEGVTKLSDSVIRQYKEEL